MGEEFESQTPHGMILIQFVQDRKDAEQRCVESVANGATIDGVYNRRKMWFGDGWHEVPCQ